MQSLYIFILSRNDSKEAAPTSSFPVTTSSLFFPLVYLVTMRVAPHAIAAVYGVTMAVVGTLFISPIKVKKLSVKGNLTVAAVGMAIVAVVYMVMGR